VFHITHAKAGSQWVFQVLSACAPGRIIHPEDDAAQFLSQPIQPGQIYPTLYVTREEFEAVSPPEPHLKFVVIRDLRDTLISWYFSVKHSHIPMPVPRFDRRRAKLNTLSLTEGLRYAMHERMPEIARIQASWVNAGVPMFRFEALLQDEAGLFERLLTCCQTRGVARATPANRGDALI
jgi:lipopolysaccharide transport system ATP-binding protein